MRLGLTLVVAEDEAGLVEQAQILTLLKWLLLDFSDHVGVVDSSRDIALESGSGGCNSVIALYSIRLLDRSLKMTDKLTSLRRGDHISGCESDCSLLCVRNISCVHTIPSMYSSFGVYSAGRCDTGKANRAKDRLHVVLVIVTRCETEIRPAMNKMKVGGTTSDME